MFIYLSLYSQFLYKKFVLKNIKKIHIAKLQFSVHRKLEKLKIGTC